MALTAILLTVSGCTGSETEGQSEENSDIAKTVEFMHLWSEGSSPAQNKVLNSIIDEFESENPDIKIEQEVLSNEQYKDKLKVLSSSNELPDVGMGWPGGWLDPYVEGNRLAPLDDVLDEEFRDKFVGGTIEAFEVEGNTYGVPTDLNIAVIYYNKSIFQEYNLKVPETYKELKEVISVLNENGVEPIALGNKDRWTGSLWYMYFADRIGGSETIVDAVQSKTFGDPSLTQAAEEIQTLVEMNAFSEGANGLTNGEAESIFMSEQAAMYLSATWALPNFTTSDTTSQEFKDAVGYFKFPEVEGGEGDINSFVGGAGGLFVAENSQVQDEAKQFVKFFIEKFGEQSLQEAGIIPAMKLDAESMDLPDMYVDVLNDLNGASDITLFADTLMIPETAQAHLEAIQTLFGMDITPEEFAELHEEALSQE